MPTTLPSQALACLEVWGGNEIVNTALTVPGLQVWVYAAPFEHAQAGGDVHFVSSCGTGRIARLLVADVAGHGEEVAETGRTLRSLIRRYMNHIDQRQFLMAMNRRFTELKHAGRFATAIAMTYFSPDAELTLCNAGHPQPLLYRHRTKRWDYLAQPDPDPTNTNNESESDTIENIPLGILSDAGYQQFKTTLEPNDLILCYTDSLIEALLPDQTLLGPTALLILIRQLPTTNPSEIIPTLLQKLTTLNITLNDDVTLLLSQSTGPAKGANFLRRLGAQFNFLFQIATLRKNIPWPEWSWKNLGGALFTKKN